jgi:ACS family hexuronate transporter-like MFS transporter
MVATMPSRRIAWAVAITAALTMTVSYVDRATLAILAPSVTRELDISETAYGSLVSAFSVAYLVSVPLSGWWIDRAGARRGLVVSVLVWSIVAALHAAVPCFAALLVARIALGVAEGPGFPGGAQTINRVLPPGDRSRGFGFLISGATFGSMIAAPLASSLYGLFGWRFAFLGTALSGILWIVPWIFLTGRADVRLVLEPSPAATPEERPPLGEVLKHPWMLRALAAIFAVTPVTGFVGSWAAKFLARSFAVKQGAMGQYLWLPNLGFDLGAILFGDLATRQLRAPGAPPRALHLVAAALTACVALLVVASSPWQATACFVLCMAGGGAVWTLVVADLLARLPRARASFAAGVLTGALSVANIIAQPLIGRVVDATGRYDGIAIGLGAWVVPGSLVWFAWRSGASPARGV